jgi:hypothetical protein
MGRDLLTAQNPFEKVNEARRDYRVWVEEFYYDIADNNMQSIGATVSDTNTPTAPSESVSKEDGYLLINPGTLEDSGTQLQFNAAVNDGAYVASAPKTCGPLTSTTTLMDTRSLFFDARIGLRTTATTWDSKCIVGWCSDDSELLNQTSGEPAIDVDGGMGFHVGEDGAFSFFGSNGAVTSSTTILGSRATNIASGVLTANTFSWYRIGLLARWIDAGTGTGTMEFFVNGRKAGQITDDLPMQGTDTYSMSFAIANGPATVVPSDLAVDYVISGYTRPGMTT